MPEPDPNEDAPSEALSLGQLLEELKKHDWVVNGRTADALAQIGAEAVPSLLQALESEDGYVRNGAAIALGKIGGKDCIQPLLRALQWRDDRVNEDDEDLEARMSAAAALGKSRDPALCEPLLAELDKILESDPSLATVIAEALGEIGDTRAIPALAKLSEHGDPAVSFALAQLGPAAIGILQGMVRDRSRRGRQSAVRALCAKATPSSIPLLLELLADSEDDKYVRGEAARGLGRYFQSPEIYSALVERLEDKNEVIRVSALLALGSLRNPAAFDIIVAHLQDPELKCTAVIALGDLGDARACGLLIPMLRSRDPSLLYHAVTALGRIGCSDAIPALIELRGRNGNAVFEAAVKASVEEALRMIRRKETNK